MINNFTSALSITSQIISHKQKLIRIYWLIYIIFVIFVAVSWLVPTLRYQWNYFGRLAADISVLFFSLAIAPGILRRYEVRQGIVKQVQVILTLFRRQNGMMMYITALGHYTWVKLMPGLYYQDSIIFSNYFELAGSTALIFLTPLFITSNDYSQRKLGPKWNVIHRLVYLICWLIFLHVALMRRVNLFTGLICVMSILELTSLLYKHMRTKINSQLPNI